MTSRIIRSATLPVVVLAVLSCSKTQDTAPERRLFGDPPIIRSVSFEHIDDNGFEVPGFGTQTFIKCDFTEIVVRQACEHGFPGVQPIAGGGWTYNGVTGKGSVGDNPTNEPGIFIEGTYGEAIFRVSVTDPNSTTAQNNLLLVGASYQPPDSKTETTLVLFDDGHLIRFPHAQAFGGGQGLNCTEVDGVCACADAVWDVTSGDTTLKDDEWTRKIAFVNAQTHEFLQDCIMRDRHETLSVPTPPNTTLTFKIEAVDRQGNLATWPTKLVGVTDPNFGKFACNGDPCGCCILWNHAPDVPACNNLPGMPGPFFPRGLCIEYSPQ